MNAKGSPRGAIAMITGSTGAIGSAIARRLAGQGYRLLLVDADARRLDRQARLYPEARTYVLDPRNREDVDAFTNLPIFVTKVPGVAIINASAIPPDSPSALDPEYVRLQLEMNLVSTACILTAVARAMAIAGRGHVVVVAPPGGFNGSTGNAVNSALILGLRTSISALRDELRPHGVQISILYPVGGKTITHSQAVSGAPDFDSINSPLYAEKVADAFLRTVRRPKLEVSVSCARTFLARLRDVVSARWRGLCAVRPRVDHNGAVTCPPKIPPFGARVRPSVSLTPSLVRSL